MGQGHLVGHIIKIIGLVALVHRYWPKGILYSEREDWEKKHHKGRGRTSRSRSKSASRRRNRGSSYAGSIYDERRKAAREDMHHVYNEGPQYSGRSGSWYYD